MLTAKSARWLRFALCIFKEMMTLALMPLLVLIERLFKLGRALNILLRRIPLDMIFDFARWE